MKYIHSAIPLITADPFLSIWSSADALGDAHTVHWTGKECPVFAGVFIDGILHPFTFTEDGSVLTERRIPEIGRKISATSTVYYFENADVKAELRFLSPLLLNRPDLFSRPIGFVEYNLIAKNGKSLAFAFGIGTGLVVDHPSQRVAIKKSNSSICCGNVCQVPLANSGDTVKIDWGYLHLADPNAEVVKIDKEGISSLPFGNIYAPYEDNAYLFTVRFDKNGVIIFGIDETYAVEYSGKKLPEYYRRQFSSFEEMTKASYAEHPEIRAACDEFDRALEDELMLHGENYALVATLAYRQAVAAHKLAANENGDLLFFSKENGSNGCIGTLDITYPSSPLFLKYAPELVTAMLRPIIEYAKSEDWCFDFTPHDVGKFPLANGQVYGREAVDITGNDFRFKGKLLAHMQMPVEEIGNMLICLAAVKKFSCDTKLFDDNRELIGKWADYLIKNGYDPDNQLCTDDFAGHLAHNCNLSAKAIIALAAYADLSGEKRYLTVARDMAKRWEKDAVADHGATRLTFDEPCGWSIKYNLVWDNILGYGLFTEKTKRAETELYKKKINRYGVPLDCRSEFAKLDWLIWSTAISNAPDYSRAVFEATARMVSETPDRVALTDRYNTRTAEYRKFTNRSVVGGVFITLLK